MSDGFRRKWDNEEYQSKAIDRIQGGKIDSKSFDISQKKDILAGRDYKIDIDSKIGKSVVVTKAGWTDQESGYYCNVCDCVIKDSMNFLDHVNGVKHQKNMGLSMKVERSSVVQVRERIAYNKKKLLEKKTNYDFEKQMEKIKSMEQQKRDQNREKRFKKREAKKLDEEKQQELDKNDDISDIMGFSNFGGKKQKL